ncbi:MAG: hypothetical protein IKY52_00415 [Clostridia bacterium]|nr:hypothetical protein [Clostridia bacterium]
MNEYEIFRENLAYADRMHRQIAGIREAQYAQIADRAMHAWRGETDTDRIASLYLTGDPFTTPEDLSLFHTNLCSPDFARFCAHFRKDASAENLFSAEKNSMMDTLPDGEDGFWDGEELEAEEYARTAYMQNSYTDRAWRQFSEAVPDMTAEYFSSYPAVCEEVYNGRCRYCILPLYTSTDGQLISFRKLLGKYDLKIAMETEVELADESLMRFALLCRRLPGHRKEASPRYMDLSVVLPENGSAGNLIASCEALGAAVSAVYTIPLEYADSTAEFCLEMYVSDADLAGLAVFLEASQLRYTVVGLYSMV